MKKCSLFLAVVMLAALFTGCGQSEIESISKYDVSKEPSSISSQIVVSNDNYSLSWNDEAKSVALTCLETGDVWSTIPTEYLEMGGSSVNVNSTLNIRVIDTSTMQWEKVAGYTGVIENGRIFCEKLEKGLRITYCFDAYEISIPVEYELDTDGIVAKIDASNIVEGGTNYLLISCSLAPFLCSVKNDAPDSYLFVPSGSGALMYTDETADEARTYSGEVYGTDPSRSVQESATEEDQVRLPVFGVKDGDSALLGIIDENSTLAFIEAEAGNGRTGYSSVYPTYYFRSYDIVKSRTTANGVGASNDISCVSEMLSQSTASVTYFPLFGEEADYNGMAKKTREYFTDKNTFVVNQADSAFYSVTLVGGIETTSLFCGFPMKTVKPMTTFAEAKEIVENLNESLGSAPAVRLQGYGNGGINGSSIAGGYTFHSVLGGGKQQAKLEDYCEKNGISLFTDFDLIQYVKTGDGFTRMSAAKTALLQSAKQYAINPPLRDFNTDKSYYILKRNDLLKALDKLLNKADKLNVSALSLSTLGSIAYSDYSETQYYAKGNMASSVHELIHKGQAAGYPIAVSGANSYAANMSDVVFDVPTDMGNSAALDVRIPFYQMVYGGTKPLYSEAINSSADLEKAAVSALSSGTGLGFTLVNNFDLEYAALRTGRLYSAVYSSNVERIQQFINTYATYYEQINHASISRYELIDEVVSKTVFDNGVILLVNQTDKTVETSVGVFAPYECKTSQEAR